MPPAPRGARISYGPRRTPAESAIGFGGILQGLRAPRARPEQGLALGLEHHQRLPSSRLPDCRRCSRRAKSPERSEGGGARRGSGVTSQASPYALRLTPHGLLVPQGLDRVQARRLHGGIEAEEN